VTETIDIYIYIFFFFLDTLCICFAMIINLLTLYNIKILILYFRIKNHGIKFILKISFGILIQLTINLQYCQVNYFFHHNYEFINSFISIF
jgi:hypothetical protein